MSTDSRQLERSLTIILAQELDRGDQLMAHQTYFDGERWEERYKDGGLLSGDALFRARVNEAVARVLKLLDTIT